MITLIAGTNRKDSEARRFAYLYQEYFVNKGQKCQILDLADLPLNLFHSAMYSAEGQSKELRLLQERLLIPADKLFFITSEYNGSFPGILKLFIDACSVHNIEGSFYGKKAGIVGVSAGRAGCLRGMDHLTGILNYLQITVLPNKLPISSISTLCDESGAITDEETLRTIDKQVTEFIDF